MVVNELLIIYVQYQVQFSKMNQRFRYKVQSLFNDLLYTVIKNNLAWAKKLGMFKTPNKEFFLGLIATRLPLVPKTLQIPSEIAPPPRNVAGGRMSYTYIEVLGYLQNVKL